MNADQKTELSRTETKAIVKLQRKALLDSVAEARRFADPRSTMPILAHVLLRLDGGALTVAATDLNLTYVDRLAVTVEGDAKLDAAFDAKKLHEVLKAQSAADIAIEACELRVVTETTLAKGRKCAKCNNIEHNDTTAKCIQLKKNSKETCGGELRAKYVEESVTSSCTLVCGRGKYKLNTLSGADFPQLPDVSRALWSRLPGATLRDLIDGTFFSISQDATRSHLNGALFEVRGDKLRMVSTDGHRLSLIERSAGEFKLEGLSGEPGAPIVMRSIIVPRDGVAEIMKLYKRDCDLAVCKSSLFVRAAGSTAVYCVKLTEAQFPPYERVIPRDSLRYAMVKRNELEEALKRLMIMASDKTHDVKLCFSEGEGRDVQLTMSTDDPDKGSASESLDCAGEGLRVETTPKRGKNEAPHERTFTNFSIRVNGKYLKEALEQVDGVDVWIGMNDELDPLLIKASAGAVDSFTVMPMRL